MSDRPKANDRRNFLKTAGVLAVAGTVAGAVDCAAPSNGDRRDGSENNPRKSFDTPRHRALLVAVGDTILPESQTAAWRAAAVTAFVAWCDGYDPVAEEMHGYGYADIRYLPPDPVPAWRAQLDGLDILAQKIHGTSFTALPLGERRAVAATATRNIRGDRLPSPLNAPHVVVAVMSHWAASADGWNMAMNARVSPGTCRPLEEATQKPMAITVAVGARRAEPSVNTTSRAERPV